MNNVAHFAPAITASGDCTFLHKAAHLQFWGIAMRQKVCYNVLVGGHGGSAGHANGQ